MLKLNNDIFNWHKVTCTDNDIFDTENAPYRLAFVDTMVDTRLRNKIKASVSECIRSQKIQPFDWLDTLQCIQKLLYLVTSNRGPYQLIDWSRTPFYTKIFRRHNWIFGKFSVNCRWRSHLISKRGFPSDFHAYNRLFSVCKHNYGNYFLHIIVCSEISLTMAQEKDSLMSYWCKIRMFKTI